MVSVFLFHQDEVGSPSFLSANASDPTTPQVAVVDDDPRLRDLLVEELEDLGVHSITCVDGAELLRSLPQERIDLILLDLMMPGMDGLACLAALQELQHGAPVVVVTALSDPQKRQQAMNAGAADYVLKPDLFALLPELLKRHLPQMG